MKKWGRLVLAGVLLPAAVQSYGTDSMRPAVTPLPIGTDSRIGGKILAGKGCLYAVGGGNVEGASQVMRLTLGPDGLPNGRKPVGEIWKGDCGACAAAISGKWLFATGGNLKGVTVRFDICGDGTLKNRTELSDGDRPRVNSGGMVASGKYLILAGGWNSRQCYSAEVKIDGSLGHWVLQRPLPQICFCQGRIFRLGNRLYAAGNQNYHSPSDRIFSAEVGDDGAVQKWRRWAGFPERAAGFDFQPMPDGKGVLFVNEESGSMYVAPIVEDGRLGAWCKLGGVLPAGPFVSHVGFPLACGKYLRLAVLPENPRKFLPSDVVEMNAGKELAR
jgi:hypothetical protein